MMPTQLSRSPIQLGAHDGRSSHAKLTPRNDRSPSRHVTMIGSSSPFLPPPFAGTRVRNLFQEGVIRQIRSGGLLAGILNSSSVILNLTWQAFGRGAIPAMLQAFFNLYYSIKNTPASKWFFIFCKEPNPFFIHRKNISNLSCLYHEIIWNAYPFGPKEEIFSKV